MRQLHSQLYEQEIPPVTVAIISPAESFSAGVAFGQAASIHKANTPPNLMSIDPDEPQGFAIWMWQQKGQIDCYPARLTYSEYLKQIYHSVHADQKLVITEYYAEASDIDVVQGEKTIFLENGRDVRAKRIVLTVGSVSAPTFNTVSGLRPLAPTEISRLASPTSVLVAGTGLTAVDCARSLARKGDFPIHMFSRNGFAPTVISSAQTYVPKYFTWHNLKRELAQYRRGYRLSRFIKLLWQELDHMDDPEIYDAGHLLAKGDLGGYWDYLLKRSMQAKLPFQDTLVATRYFAHRAWNTLSKKEQIVFQQKLGAFWACWRHPIPVEVVQELNQYAHEGRLHIHRLITPLKYRAGRYVLETPYKTIDADFLIDGTGGSNNAENLVSTLIRNLLAKGLAKSHPCGGIRVDSLTYAVSNDVGVSGIYCLGPLAKGTLFSTNAFWFNSYCATNLARHFAVEMRLEVQREVFS